MTYHESCPDCAAKQVVLDAISKVLDDAGYHLPLQEQVGAVVQERDAMRAELKLMEHKVITCGVAASNPDPDLTTTKKCYAETWNSPQADAVRALRKERDALRAEIKRLRAELLELLRRIVRLDCPTRTEASMRYEALRAARAAAKEGT